MQGIVPIVPARGKAPLKGELASAVSRRADD